MVDEIINKTIKIEQHEHRENSYSLEGSDICEE